MILILEVLKNNYKAVLYSQYFFITATCLHFFFMLLSYLCEAIFLEVYILASILFKNFNTAWIRLDRDGTIKHTYLSVSFSCDYSRLSF